MRLGSHSMMFTKAFSEKDLPLLDKISNMGFNTFEIQLNSPSKIPVQGLKEKLDETGLRPITGVTLTEEQDLLSSDKEVRQTGVEFLKDMSDLARQLGSEVIGGVNYAAWGKFSGRARTDEEWHRCKESLKEVAQYAQTRDVKIALEPINRFETYFLNTAEDARRLVEEIDEPNVGIHLDTFHMNIEEKNFYDPIITAGDKLYHFHICENDRGVPGTGHVEWEGTFDALNEIGYDETVVVESFVPEIEEVATQTAIWREIAPSADAILEGAKDVFEKHTG